MRVWWWSSSLLRSMWCNKYSLSVSLRLFQSIIVIDNRRLYGVICIWSKSHVRWWHVIVHQSMFVICLSSNKKFIIESWQLAKNVFRQSSLNTSRWKTFCLVGIASRRECWWPSIVRCKHCVIVVDWKKFRWWWNLYSSYSQSWTDGIN